MSIASRVTGPYWSVPGNPGHENRFHREVYGRITTLNDDIIANGGVKIEGNFVGDRWKFPDGSMIFIQGGSWDLVVKWKDGYQSSSMYGQVGSGFRYKDEFSGPENIDGKLSGIPPAWR